MSQAVAANGNAPHFGDLVQDWACDRFDMEFHDKSHYDALRPDGTKVEVRGAQVWIQNGYCNGDPTRTRGRFKFWSASHDDLAADDGVYLLIVYETVENDDGEDEINVLAFRWVNPATITEVVGDCWYDVRSNPRTATKGDPYRLSWSHIFQNGEVEA